MDKYHLIFRRWYGILMSVYYKNVPTMKKEQLSQLIEKTFAKLACPMPGVGLYSELQNALTLAFKLLFLTKLKIESLIASHYPCTGKCVPALGVSKIFFILQHDRHRASYCSRCYNYTTISRNYLVACIRANSRFSTGAIHAGCFL